MIPIGIGINEDVLDCWSDNGPPYWSACERTPATDFGLCLAHYFEKTGRIPDGSTMKGIHQARESFGTEVKEIGSRLLLFDGYAQILYD